MSVVLQEAFASRWREEEAFDRVRELRGQVVRHKEGRRTLRFEFAGAHYYLKHHRGVGWSEILKNWGQLKAPITSAENEWRAINRLRELGIHTLTPRAYGRRGFNPATRESFLITEELRGTISLARYAEHWPERPPAFSEKQQLIRAVADIARRIHEHGINHRDLYICHFLLDRASASDQPRLYLVDLHRAQCRRQVPRRWRVKDVGSIYFSAMDIGLTRRDVLRFLRIYFGRPLRELLRDERKLLREIEQRATRLYRRDFKREPVLIL